MSPLLILGTLLFLPIFFVLCKLIPWLVKVRRIRRSIEVFNVTEPHWLLGHLKDHPGHNEAGLMKYVEWTEKAKSKGCFSLLYPLRPTLLLCHPDTIKAVLKTSAPKGILPALGWSYWVFDYWLGEGLLTANGSTWARKRRLLTPAFHFDILKPYTQVFNGCVEQMMEKFEQHSIAGKSMEVFDPVSLCMLHSLMKCTFSSTENVQTDGNKSPYVHTVQRLANHILKRMMYPPHYLDQVYFLTKDGEDFMQLCKFSHSVTNACINKRREVLKENSEKSHKRYVDFLDILLLARDEDGRGLSPKEIQDEVETFMFEGHDTTSSGLAWCLYNLARHPEYQTKAREEVDGIMQGKSCLEWDDLSHLTYLTMCIKESMRLHTPVPFSQRELTESVTLAGHRLEPGTPIELSWWCVHHNRQVWGDDHMQYKPDRFTQDRMATMDSHAFLAFSAGSRNCIGQVFALNELKVSVGRILHQFDMKVDETHHVEMVPELITRPKNGIKIFFNKRDI